MKTLSAFLLLMALGASAPAAETPVAKTAPAAVELKTKSVYTAENGGRNPFWPIGWKPAVRTSNATQSSGPDLAPAAFVVTSITLDHGAHFAIINGKAMTEGQQFGLQVGSQTYAVTVKAIEDGRVILLRHDQEIVVTLRRR